MAAMKKVGSKVGSFFRSLGAGFEELGVSLQGGLAAGAATRQPITTVPYRSCHPRSAAGFVAPSASVVGNVRLGANSSVWYGAVIRGDVNSISVGEGTNIQAGQAYLPHDDCTQLTHTHHPQT